MNNECSIVRDLLALYSEGMVSSETADFVKAHLGECNECSELYESMRSDQNSAKYITNNEDRRKNALSALIGIRKKLRKKTIMVISITVVCLIGLGTLGHYFPIHRIIRDYQVLSYYEAKEIMMLITAGSNSDRAEAQSVLRMADSAFRDCIHTNEENKEKYGLLSRYATDARRGGSYATYSLELLSAHFEGSQGYLWVRYSHEVYNAEGETLRGSWDIPSLWIVEMAENGEWIVINIKEMP